MLYLINETFYNKSTKEIIDILKIGYTSDTIKSGSRYTTYLNHCPEAKLLYEIPGGTLDHEAALLSKFHHLLYKGNEWFRYSQEIIDYFKTHRDLESLSDLRLPEIQHEAEIKDYCGKCLNLLLHERVSCGELSLEQATNSVKPMLDVLLSKRFKNIIQIDRYFLSVFDFDVHEKDIKSVKITEFLAQFDSYTRFTDKMKFLCDNVNSFTEEEFSSILGSIDIVFKNYYITVGPEKIRNLQYKNSVIKSEYDRLLNNQIYGGNLKDKIYESFKIGERYTRSFIKERLGEIYSNLGIQSSPKAIDIEKYFEIKSVLVSNRETGKRDSLYLILKKKE